MLSGQGALFDRVNFELDADPPVGVTPSGVVWDRENPLPVAPSAAPAARHASATGAQAAATTRGALTLRYVQLLRSVGPMSDHEAAGALGVGLSSINSTRAKLGARIVEASGDFETVRWPGGRKTARVRWVLAQEGTV